MKAPSDQRKRAIREGMHAQNPHCYYCGKRFKRKNQSTLDHVIPKCRGGDDDPANLVLACARCNVGKSGMTPAEWALVLIHQLEGVMAIVGETSPGLLAD